MTEFEQNPEIPAGFRFYAEMKSEYNRLRDAVAEERLERGLKPLSEDFTFIGVNPDNRIFDVDLPTLGSDAIEPSGISIRNLEGVDENIESELICLNVFTFQDKSPYVLNEDLDAQELWYTIVAGRETPPIIVHGSALALKDSSNTYRQAKRRIITDEECQALIDVMKQIQPDEDTSEYE